MKRVTGLGGIFIKYDNPENVREWYKQHLGIQTDSYGSSFEWRKTDKPEEKGYSVWSTFKKDTTYFHPSTKDFMLNFRVNDIEALLKVLKDEGVTVLDEIETFEYGKFAHILDPEGNKIELWEANDEEYEKILGDGITK